MKSGLVFLYLFLFVFVPIANAHPGRTASDGCHYCRTNCDSWEVAWNQRHCHGGGSSSVQEAPVVQKPTYIPPTVVPTKYIPSPTSIPKVTRIPTSTSIATNAPTSEPTEFTEPTKTTSNEPKKEVKGEAIQPTVAVAQSSTDDPVGGLLAMGVIGGGAYWIYKRLRRKS